MRVLLIEAPYHKLYAQRDKVTLRRDFPLGIGYVAVELMEYLRSGYGVLSRMIR